MNNRHWLTLKIVAGSFAVCNILFAVCMLYYNLIAFWAIITVTLILSLVTLAVVLSVRKSTDTFLQFISNTLHTSSTEELQEFPVPVLACSTDCKVLWHNQLFEQKILGSGEARKSRLQEIEQYNLKEACSILGIQMKLSGGFYQVFGVQTKKKKQDVIILYFQDITKLKETEIEYKLSRPTVLLIMLDNYEEVWKNAKESEKSHILSAIDKILEDFISETNGFIRKIEKDRFVIVIEQRHLDAIIKNRFKILDLTRSIDTSGLYPITLSIGAERGAKNLSESENFATQALDMALGRGGDQAAVKTSDGYDFFGGVSKGVEKRTKVKTRIVAQALHELVQASDNILLMGHRFGDLDCTGAAVGLAGAFRSAGKKAHVVVDYMKSLSTVLIDRSREEGLVDLFVSPVESMDMVMENTLLIIVDTHSPTFVESTKLYHACKNVVVIDHHRKMVNYINDAVIFYHEPYSASASEMVTELIQYLPLEYKIGRSEAEALLAGVMLDTRNFIIRTGVRTFEAAAYLRRLGADTVNVRKFFAGSMDSYQRKSKLVANADIYRECAVASSAFSFDDIRVIAPQAADELLSISDVKASFVIYPVNENVNISARSMGEMNVQVIMEALNGGGHQTMAATQLGNISVEDAKNMLVEAIDAYYDTKND